MPIVQITAGDVERSSTLEVDDIGKWCLVVQGCFLGFYDTRAEAQVARG